MNAVPGADTTSYDALVRAGMAMIPAHAPRWTDHNPSDPGVTLIELLAYVTEILAWRALRVTPDARLNLLRLLQGPERPSRPGPEREAWVDAGTLEGGSLQMLQAAWQRRVALLSQAACLVTPGDVESAASACAARWLRSHGAAAGAADTDLVATAAGRGDPQRHPARPARADARAAGDLWVVVEPRSPLDADAARALRAHVADELAPGCLLTARVHVLLPVTVTITIACRIVTDAGQPAAAVRDGVQARLGELVGRADAAAGGETAAGRTLWLSEIAAVIDRCSGVDHVRELAVTSIAETGAESAAAASVGLRPGLHATIGIDSRLGGPKLQRDPLTGALSLRLRPWERASVRLGAVLDGDADHEEAGGGFD